MDPILIHSRLCLLTGPVNVEFDLLLHVPTKSVKEACAAAMLAPSSRVATEASILVSGWRSSERGRSELCAYATVGVRAGE